MIKIKKKRKATGILLRRAQNIGMLRMAHTDTDYPPVLSVFEISNSLDCIAFFS